MLFTDSKSKRRAAKNIDGAAPEDWACAGQDDADDRFGVVLELTGVVEICGMQMRKNASSERKTFSESARAIWQRTLVVDRHTHGHYCLSVFVQFEGGWRVATKGLISHV